MKLNNKGAWIQLINIRLWLRGSRSTQWWRKNRNKAKHCSYLIGASEFSSNSSRYFRCFVLRILIFFFLCLLLCATELLWPLCYVLDVRFVLLLVRLLRLFVLRGVVVFSLCRTLVLLVCISVVLVWELGLFWPSFLNEIWGCYIVKEKFIRVRS